MLSFRSHLLQAMVTMNKQVNVPALTKIMTEFARENEKAELMGEMMGDAMDDAMTEEGDEEEQERIVGAVLTELGLSMTDAVPEAPGQQPAQAAPTKAEEAPVAADPAMSDLEARLNNLRREG